MNTLRKEYGIECLQCAVSLQNEMEQLVGLCPLCFRTGILENKKWFLNNNTVCVIPGEQQIKGPLRLEAVRRSDYKCQECNTNCLESELRIDLIVPIGKGGHDELSNMQVLCKKCMRSRGNEIWRAGH